MDKLKKYFLFDERRTDLRTETVAGITTFLSMMYIVVVNPTVFSAAGVDFGGVFIATIIATVAGTLIMGLFANYPIAIAPGLGINAYVVYTVVVIEGFSWQQAFGACIVASGIFILLSVTQFREVFINSIPEPLKKSIASGIGLFIALIGCVNGGIVKDSPATLITLGATNDITFILTIVGLFVTMIFMVVGFSGAIFFGMIFTTIVAGVLGVWQLPAEIFSMPHGLENTFMQVSFENIPALAPVIFTVLLVTLFDTTGTMLGIGQQAGLIKDGKFPNLKSALLADSVGSFFGALSGTSPTSAYVESGTGVSAGGRTGFASVVTAGLFILLLFFQPLAATISAVPSITAPALILTGCFMLSNVSGIDWKDYSEAFPAFLTVSLIPFTYSITNGIGAGIITYVVLKSISGNYRQIPPLLAVMAVLFAIQFVM